MMCYMCKQDTKIDDGYASSWKLDCLHCLKINELVTCSFTMYTRFIDRSGVLPLEKVGEWKLRGASLYFRIPERTDDMFFWTFNTANKSTTLTRVGDADTGVKKVYTFDKIMDINLDNLISKTKLTLTFS